MNIAGIEDTLINTIKQLGLFQAVSSAGRKGLPQTFRYPSCFVYFVSDRDARTGPRPTIELTYEAMVVDKNLRTEKEAARDVYTLIDAVRDAINGKTLGIPDIEPWTCTGREIAGYEIDTGEIAYVLRFRTRQYLAIP